MRTVKTMFRISLFSDRFAVKLRRRLVAANLGALAPDALQKCFLAHRLIFIRLWQASIVALSLVAAFLVRFDFLFPRGETKHVLEGLVIALCVKMIVFSIVGVEHGWWRFSGLSDLVKLVFANLIGSAVFTVLAALLVGPNFPRSVYLIDFLLCFIAMASARMGVRLYHEMVLYEVASKNQSKGLLIYGAGMGGLNLVREIRSSPSLNYRIIGFLDDDEHKRNVSLVGVPVLGCGRDAARIVDRYRHSSPRIDEIVIAMPSATGRQISEALANCRASGVSCKTIPGLGELLSGRVKVSQIREIAVEDLLGREPVNLEHEKIKQSIAGRSVMVTGAGGSIGSELCRQLVQFQPKCLIALDQAESDLFKIEMELKRTAPSAKVCPIIGDIRDYDRMEEVICQYGVNSIFHAAAYKHVPMMENSLIEAVTNNVLGLHNVAQASARNGVTSFVMISSDKAVNPTNIMGLTKRVSELVVSSMPKASQGGATRFVSVRFGNVLGSNGSVVPIFKEQIAAGGPVTITHPDMRRYFMTIPEAVQLVLQASTMGKGSEVFVLDMGEPVRILDLARNMIRLSGHEPDVEIPIRFTGLRPGEKLYEELATASDQVRPTCHEKIMIFCGPHMLHEPTERWITELRSLLALRDQGAVLTHLSAIAPEYTPSVQWRSVLSKYKIKSTAVSA
ncbi:MAG TPA: nucleoside-diphosphate sugar epimerase/dehydratase [Candidatus Acidoferrales bacterium]|nr:nucleoside-diphosphate sugar epimerase/dehydratase [Candidatus Acidoferrales bacterium]